jgi:hypothetical protein
MDADKTSNLYKGMQVRRAEGEVTSSEYEYYCWLSGNYTEERLNKLVRKIEFVRKPFYVLYTC